MNSIKNVVEKNKKDNPVRILQIGEGNFLRAFSCWMVECMHKAGVYDGMIQMVQVMPKGLSDMINNQDGMYTVLERGLEQGEAIERATPITIVSGCLSVYDDFQGFLKLAKNPELSVVISNTTEAGITYQSQDKKTDEPPSSFPAKMVLFLYHRYQHFDGADDKGLLFLPVELIDRNGDKLLEIMLHYADEWKLEPAFVEWLKHKNMFTNTLVDRIVSGYPKAEAESIEAALGYTDQLLDVCEPFHSWIVESEGVYEDRFPASKAKLGMKWVTDQGPYRTRKVRILNGTHTASVLAAYLSGFDIVMDMMQDEVFGSFVDKLQKEEIIPTMDLPREELEEFAESVKERFLNPFLNHKLLDISLNSVSKFKTRCLPTILDYQKNMGKAPELLCYSFAALLCFYKGIKKKEEYMGIREQGDYPIRDDDSVLQFMADAWSIAVSAEELVKTVLSNDDFWGEDLTQYPAIVESVIRSVEGIQKKGARKTVEELL